VYRIAVPSASRSITTLIISDVPAPAPADDDAPAFVARIALSAIVISCYPLAFNSLRGSVAALLPAAWQARMVPPSERGSGGSPKAKVSDADAEDTALRGGGGVSSGEDGELECSLLGVSGGGGSGGDDGDAAAVGGRGGCCGGLTVSHVRAAVRDDWPHALLTAALVGITVLVAAAIPQIEVVLGYKGALGGSLIVYILPATMLFSLTQQARASAAAAGGRAVVGGVVDAGPGGIEAGEGTPLAVVAAAPAVWDMSAVLGTPHGWLFAAALAWGALIMVTGTLSTAGVL
jgi:hypothetical protein